MSYGKVEAEKKCLDTLQREEGVASEADDGAFPTREDGQTTGVVVSPNRTVGRARSKNEGERLVPERERGEPHVRFLQ